jgi:hypothetical protein
LAEALKGRRLKLGETHPHTLKSLDKLINLYEAWNKPKKASEWREIRHKLKILKGDLP